MTKKAIPDIDPKISISTKDALNVILLSIGYEEISLAQVIRAEAKKVQYVIEQLKCDKLSYNNIKKLVTINETVSDTLGQVIKKEMLLESKMKEAIKALKYLSKEDPKNDKCSCLKYDDCFGYNSQYDEHDNITKCEPHDTDNYHNYRRCPDIQYDNKLCKCDENLHNNRYTLEELEVIKDIEREKYHNKNKKRTWF